MRRIKKNIFITALVCLVMFSECNESYLEQTNTTDFSIDAIASKQSSVIGVINGIYDTYQNSDLLKKCIWYRANFSTHDFFNWGGDVFWNNYQIPATFGGLTTLWERSYIAIARANSAFPIITRAQQNEVIESPLANRLRGEALFMRGLTYYYMASSFGGVPLEIDTIGSLNLGLRPRSTRDSVFMQVASDMKAAAALLLSKTELQAADLGRATKGAALA